MTVTVGARFELRVGEPTVVQSSSPSMPFGVAFEDDGETGYLYALEYNMAEQPIQDAVHIYNVAGVTDRAIPSTVEIVWSSDGQKAGLILNSYHHAIIDFGVRRIVCRSGFPAPWHEWTGHDWDESFIALLT